MRTGYQITKAIFRIIFSSGHNDDSRGTQRYRKIRNSKSTFFDDDDDNTEKNKNKIETEKLFSVSISFLHDMS
jgi:hypothetical protein